MLRLSKRYALLCSALVLDLFEPSLNAQEYALIGGMDQGSSAPYAALVSSSGVTTPLSGPALPVGDGQIYSVAINDSGAGIIGGIDQSSSTPYAALISSSGVTTPLSGPALPVGNGQISSVAINNSGAGIIGGGANSEGYAALVSSSGITTALSGPAVGSAFINSVAINDSGSGIIGGVEASGAPYAALVSSSGVTTTALLGSAAPVEGGAINSVAINDSGAGIVGGQDHDSSTPYVALVSPSGVTTPLSGPAAPVGDGGIYSVAINNSGAGIVGGQDHTSTSYAALVSSPSGNTTPLSGPAVPGGNGSIYSVAINNSGAGIIGGTKPGGTPYATLVSPSGVTTALSGSALPVGTGSIYSVAIDDSGAAIIGGRDHGSTPYAALVSPSGVTTALSGSALPVGTGTINSVAIAIAGVVPKSFGPGSSFATSLFALTSQILPNHLIHHQALTHPIKDQREIGLLADASDKVRKSSPSRKEAKYSFWTSLLGEYAHQDKVQQVPALTNSIGGALLALDYRGIQNFVIGGGAAYAFNYADLSQSAGHASTHQEFLTLYASWTRKNLFIDFALWGGYYQMHNVRHSVAHITSKANVTGWLLSPHLEISTPFYAKGDWFTIGPFAMFDWASNWQGDIQEHGASGFNILVDDQYTSILRSEVGLRLFESIRYGWGKLILQEKASWVNKKPFAAGTTTATFVGAFSSFSIEMFTSETQNLGAVQLNGQFIPYNSKYPYGAINYQGEFGSSFQSHLVSLEIGKDF